MQVIAILAPHKNLFSLLAALSISALIFTSCSDLSEEQSRKVNEALNDSLTSTTETWDVDMEIIEEGQLKVEVLGSYAAAFNTDNLKETRIQGPVHINVFDSTGAVKTRVDCNRAVYRAKEAEFELYGDVRVNTRDKRHLKSEYLKWNQNNNLITTPKFVVITTPTDSIAGSGFSGTTDLSQYTIKEPKGRVIVE